MTSINLSQLTTAIFLFATILSIATVTGFQSHVSFANTFNPTRRNQQLLSTNNGGAMIFTNEQNERLTSLSMKNHCSEQNKIANNGCKTNYEKKNVETDLNLKRRPFLEVVATSMAVLYFSFIPVSLAVVGGGKDYAMLDVTGQDFSNKNYKAKDFTQIIAKGTTFAKSNLQGCRFYKAYLVDTDFSGADLRGSSLEDTSMDNANLKDANVSGAYFSASLLDVISIENADFTDAQLPPKVLERLCEREDAIGVNPSTGIETRESLMCP